jgi:hypothetical protein
MSRINKGLLGAPVSECVGITRGGDFSYHWIYIHDQVDWRSEDIRRMERGIPPHFNNVVGISFATGEARLKYSTVSTSHK